MLDAYHLLAPCNDHAKLKSFELSLAKPAVGSMRKRMKLPSSAQFGVSVPATGEPLFQTVTCHKEDSVEFTRRVITKGLPNSKENGSPTKSVTSLSGRRNFVGMQWPVFALLPVALARPLEDWWICDQASSGGLDWPKLKFQMQSIAGWDPGVYGLKTQAHTELMMVLYARVDRWHRKDSDCPLGELSFRWLLLASQEQKNLLGSFKRVNSGKIENWLDSLLDASWSDVWKLAAQWHEVLASGWPLFALMGLCSKKLRSLGDSEVLQTVPCPGGEEHLQRFTLALEEDGMLPPAALEKALESAAVQECAYARATVYVFAADSVRRGREEGLLLDLESATEMLSKAQVAAHSSRALVEVMNPWPLWKALDRFSCAGLVNVSVQQVPNFLPVRKWFWIFVSPTRANHQDQVISNSVRAKQQPYCSREFRDSLAQVASQAPSHWQPRLVEVGAHFGDCMLWAAAAIPGVPWRELTGSEGMSVTGEVV
eukprot:s2018_g11.t1